MSAASLNQSIERLSARLGPLWEAAGDREQLAKALHALDGRYDLSAKLAREPGVGEIVQQMIGRLAASFESLTELRGKRILDIACGSNTSRAPASLYIDTPFGAMKLGRENKGYTAQFEPWFCRILLELGAEPVGVDRGDLEREAFEHYQVDLGEIGALDFLPAHSFDALQDSRLFGSPEFTTQFPQRTDRLKIAGEIVAQERRLLAPGGTVIHSDAAVLLR